MTLNDSNDPFFPDGLPAFAWRAPGVPAVAVESRQAKPLAIATQVPDSWALLKALRRHWWLAIGLGTLFAALTGTIAWRLVPSRKYTASALIEVKTQRPILLTETHHEKPDYKVFQSTQLALVRSRLVLAAALKRPEVATLKSVRAQADPVDWLEEQIVAEFLTGSELLRLSMSGNHSGDTAIVVNAVAEAYLDEILSKDHHEQLAAAAKLKSLQDEYNEKLTRHRASLRKLAESVGSDDKQTLALKQQFALQQLAQEKAEHQKVQLELKRSSAELSILRADEGPIVHQPLDDSSVEEALSRDPMMEKHKLMANELAIKLERTRRLVRSDTDPSVRDLRIKQESVRRALFARRAELWPKVEKQIRQEQGDGPSDRLGELSTRIKVLSEYDKVLRQEIDRLEVDAQSFNRQTIDLQWMKDEITQWEEIARHLGERMGALNVELKAPQRGRVIERADNPRIESPRKRLAAIGLAMLGVFSLTVLGVSWREFRIRRVDTPGEVVDSLGLRLVGTLPTFIEPGRIVVSNENGNASGTDSFRFQNLLIESIDAARTVLLRECRDEDLRVILITSASKGEGKSSLSSHLAISLARTGRRTLLADFDLRSPSAYRLFDVPSCPGVCELLRDEISIEESVHAVMADLDVVPAGHCDARSIRALAQDGLPVLIARLKARYDFVVIDSAPLLPVADSLLLGQHVDAVLLSVFRAVSRMPAVHAGYQRLATLGVRVLGVVVTGVAAGHHEEVYHSSVAQGR
ncbi:MAG: hypothetical protein NVSMB9_00880 [Isosphaeraceae bacterium]